MSTAAVDIGIGTYTILAQIGGEMFSLPLAEVEIGIGDSNLPALLISSFDVPPQVAVGSDLLYASITKTAGSWRHHVADHVISPESRTTMRTLSRNIL